MLRVRRLCRHDGTCPARVRARRRGCAPAKLRGGASQRHVSFEHFWRKLGAWPAHAPPLRLRDCRHAVTRQTRASSRSAATRYPKKVPPNSRRSQKKDLRLLPRTFLPPLKLHNWRNFGDARVNERIIWFWWFYLRSGDSRPPPGEQPSGPAGGFAPSSQHRPAVRLCLLCVPLERVASKPPNPGGLSSPGPGIMGDLGHGGRSDAALLSPDLMRPGAMSR